MNRQKFLPIVYATTAIICFVTMQVFVKLLSHQITTEYIIEIRSIVLLAFNSMLIYNSADYEPYLQSRSISNQDITKNDSKKYFSINIKSTPELILMIKRQVLSTITVSIYLYSLKYISISIANSLYNTTPVLTFFLQAIYYKKALNKLNFLIVFLSFIGVVLMINPFGNLSSVSFSPQILLPLVAAMANCLNFIYLHQMRGYKELMVLEYTYIFQLLSNSLVSVIIGGVSALPSTEQPVPYSIGEVIVLCLLIIIFTYASNFLRIMAIFKRKPSEILAFNYFGIIYSIILDVYFFQNNFQWITILGVLFTSTGLLSQIVISIANTKI